MASIFVWLRYSSARHLTWQRNYNTQPRILGEAQAKLTHKIAEVMYCICSHTKSSPLNSQEVELMMQTQGHTERQAAPSIGTLDNDQCSATC